MNLSIISNINFQKTLKAKCNVIKGKDKPCECKIYELDYLEDKDYFSKLLNKKSWRNANYLEFINYDFKYYTQQPNSHIYTLENNSGKCLGYAVTINGKHVFSLELLETAPKYKNEPKDKSSRYKYVGETLVSFITKCAMQEKRKFIDVEAANSAIKFYTDNCGFYHYDDSNCELYLNKSNFAKLIEQNEKHTKGKIDFTC